jgi:hypothetical protein
MSLAQAQETGVLLEMKLSRNGEQIAAPKVWSKFGSESTVQVGSTIRVEVTSTDLGSTADMRFKVFTDREGQLTLAAQPRLHAAFGAESSFIVKGQDGVEYKVALFPAKQVRPS